MIATISTSGIATSPRFDGSSRRRSRDKRPRRTPILPRRAPPGGPRAASLFRHSGATGAVTSLPSCRSRSGQTSGAATAPAAVGTSAHTVSSANAPNREPLIVLPPSLFPVVPVVLAWTMVPSTPVRRIHPGKEGVSRNKGPPAPTPGSGVHLGRVSSCDQWAVLVSSLSQIIEARRWRPAR